MRLGLSLGIGTNEIEPEKLIAGGVLANDTGAATLLLANDTIAGGTLADDAGASAHTISIVNPAILANCVGCYQSRAHASIATAPITQGVAPPTVTFGGSRINLTPVPAVYVQIDGAGTLGVATFKWSVDGGVTFQQTGILTSASVTLPAPLSGFTVAFSAGAYLTSHIYEGTCSSLINQISGSAGPLAQATASKRPKLTWNVGGGAPVLDGDGVDDDMTGGVSTIQPTQFFVLGKWDSAYSANSTLIDGISGNLARFFRTGATTGACYAGTQINMTGLTPQAWHVHEILFNGASFSYKEDAIQQGSGNAGANNAAGLTLLSFGAGGSDFADASIAEVLVFSAAVDADTSALLYTYMNSIKNALT